MSRTQRIDLIRKIEEIRHSHVITYITGDREGVPPAQIASDAVRQLYRHIRLLGGPKVKKIDLYLYSRGGHIHVPWSIVAMFREHYDEFNVIVPYKAHSAATLIAIGADEIVMGRKGELGPIDATQDGIPIQRGANTQREAISVEDVMSYVLFIKDRAGLGDQSAISDSISILAQKLDPWIVGSIYRTHSYIRLIAEKLLTSHNKVPKEQDVRLVTEALAEKMYFHGHTIGRKEAQKIQLPIAEFNEELDDLMWALYEEYEESMKLNKPFDAVSSIPSNTDEYSERITLAYIESVPRSDVFRGTLRARHVRQLPPQLNLNANASINLPPNIPVASLSDAVAAQLKQTAEQLQRSIAELVRQEIQRQAPIKETRIELLGGSWQNATTEPD
jgi:hypothetical protein